MRTRPIGFLATLASALFAMTTAPACARDTVAPVHDGSSGDEAAPATKTQTDVPSTSHMSLDAMDSVVRAVAPDVQRQEGIWAFEYLDVPVLVITDAAANRMRVVSPVVGVADVTNEQWASIMVANFHTALDARYAVSEGVVYSVFLHPLGSLTEPDLRSAISQVVVLSKTFGSTYNSSALTFSGAASE